MRLKPRPRMISYKTKSIKLSAHSSDRNPTAFMAEPSRIAGRLPQISARYPEGTSHKAMVSANRAWVCNTWLMDRPWPCNSGTNTGSTTMKLWQNPIR